MNAYEKWIGEYMHGLGDKGFVPSPQTAFVAGLRRAAEISKEYEARCKVYASSHFGTPTQAAVSIRNAIESEASEIEGRK